MFLLGVTLQRLTCVNSVNILCCLASSWVCSRGIPPQEIRGRGEEGQSWYSSNSLPARLPLAPLSLNWRSLVESLWLLPFSGNFPLPLVVFPYTHTFVSRPYVNKRRFPYYKCAFLLGPEITAGNRFLNGDSGIGLGTFDELAQR